MLLYCSKTMNSIFHEKKIKMETYSFETIKQHPPRKLFFVGELSFPSWGHPPSQQTATSQLGRQPASQPDSQPAS